MLLATAPEDYAGVWPVKMLQRGQLQAICKGADWVCKSLTRWFCCPQKGFMIWQQCLKDARVWPGKPGADRTTVGCLQECILVMQEADHGVLLLTGKLQASGNGAIWLCKSQPQKVQQ
jgi:hypothetical protein